MWKAPYRPNNEISQSFNSGIVSIYSVKDTAAPGDYPAESLTLKIVLRYSERQVGVTRYYSAKQNMIDVERVIRVMRSRTITNQDVAITEDGARYSIDLVQLVNDVYPQCVDLTLKRIDQKLGNAEVME